MTTFYIIIIISFIFIIDGVYNLCLRKPKFSIIRMKISKEGEKAYHPLKYRIKQQQVFLFGLIKYWSTPTFAPPHLFEKTNEAFNKIIEEVGVGNSIIIVGENEK